MTDVLVVEDETDLSDIIAFNLEREGWSVRVAHTGARALLEVRKERPDLIILDLMLPDMTGTEICRTLREDAGTRDILILMLTARDGEQERVAGFEAGADDYVTKPFSIRELMLRVHALLRRGARQSATTARTIGVLEIDRDAHRVWVEGVEVTLTALEFRLLGILLDRAGRVQSRETLLSDVWEVRADLTTRTVDTHVTRLRRKIGAASEYIETIRGVGYRFRDLQELRARG